MKKISFKILLPIVLLFISATSFADEDVTAITSVIQKYFDGTSKGQPELVKQAFAESLELQYVGKKGELKRWQGTDYVANIKQGKIKNRIGKIVSMDITGNAAVVKATVTSGKTLFTDYLLLLKLKSGWVITNKIFIAQKR